MRLGRSNLLVSEVGFGGIPIQRPSEREATRVIHRCLELGLNFLDTANFYGSSEERIGRAIAGRRQGLVLATKNSARLGPAFLEQMELSFQRLNVEHIDLLQFQQVSTEEAYRQILAPEGPMDIALRAKAQGRVGHIGVSSHSLDLALKLARSGHFETLMFPFNFVTNEAASELIPVCREYDVGFIAMKPMAGGLLENAELAFKYLRQFSDVVPVLGVEKTGEIEDVASLLQGPAQVRESDRAEMECIREGLGTRFCRRCEYCLPCPQGLDIPVLVNLKAFVKRFPPERMFGPWGAAIVAQSENCADCGECESRCPYQLPIRETIRDNAAWYRRQRAKQSLVPVDDRIELAR